MADVNATAIIQIIDHLKDIITPIGVEVYKIYYTQVLYNGIISVLINLFFITGMPYITYKCWEFTKFYTNEHDGDDTWEMISAIATIITIVGGLISIFALPDSVMHVINPDYYVIQELLNNV